MLNEDVFDAVARLVAGGQYRDSLLGLPGVDLDGGGSFQRGPDGTLRRMYTRGSRRYVEAHERGWIEPLPPLRPAPPAAVEEAETLAGTALPALLRRLYLEVGNGGFGPGYGVLGLRDGHASERSTALTGLQARRGIPAEAGQPRVPMILCEWGCGISTEVDLADGQIWGYDPNPGPSGVSPLFPQHLTIGEWFQRWVDGPLHQPWLVEDPETGEWRGATDAEHRAAIEEAFGPDGPPD